MTQSKPGKGANSFPFEIEIVEPWMSRNCGYISVNSVKIVERTIRLVNRTMT